MTKSEFNNSPLSFFLTAPKSKPSRQRVKMAVDFIKEVIKHEPESSIKRDLANVGIQLNNILVRL